jgi:hypothetical protein
VGEMHVKGTVVDLFFVGKCSFITQNNINPFTYHCTYPDAIRLLNLKSLQYVKCSRELFFLYNVMHYADAENY